MRERQGNITQAAAPSVTAPTLSKLLAAETPVAASSSMNSVVSHAGALPKVSQLFVTERFSVKGQSNNLANQNGCNNTMNQSKFEAVA